MAKNRCAKKRFYNEDPQRRKRELAWLKHRLGQHRGLVCGVCILGLLGTGMSLVSGVASKYLIDAVTGFDFGALWTAAAVMAAMLLGSQLLKSVASRVSARGHIQVRNQIQDRVFSRILRASWQASQQYRSGDLLNRLNGDIATVSDGVTGFLPSVLTAALKFLGAFGLLLYYDPVAAVIALVGAPVTLLLSGMLMRRLRRHDLQLKTLTGELMSFQEDSLRNLTDIQAFSAAAVYEKEMRRQQNHYQNAFLSANSFRIGMSVCISLVNMLVTAACLGWGVYRLWTGRITYGSLMLFLQMASMLRSALSAMVSLAQQSVSIATSAGRVMDVEDLPEEDRTAPEGFGDEKELGVSLNQVRFQYASGDTVLDHFDFYAKPGEFVAVTGASGEGKTTLLRLLLGLVEPCDGDAELIGSGGKRYRIGPGTRGGFSYVPQGNSVFPGTVAQNLRILAPEATQEQMEAALKTACAWDFVQKLSGGLEHSLGPEGQGISEGQAQRIAIARALLRRAPILLLDEATSALDENTERQLLANLRRSGMVQTCIFVTHRRCGPELCGRTYRIHQKTVTEAENGT